MVSGLYRPIAAVPVAGAAPSARDPLDGLFPSVRRLIFLALSQAFPFSCTLTNSDPYSPVAVGDYARDEGKSAGVVGH